ncbi:type II toxin-antitoxin system RelE/ParE family toxin, partial [bacterium]|nr:type II toxin-antitoxin system RelE/ParE family toxin [bacterium]
GAGYRYLIVDNYLIFYTIEEETIFVHRIIHGARDYRRLL